MKENNNYIVLPKAIARKLISELADLFNYNDWDYIEKYFATTPKYVPFVGYFNRNGFPCLWFPQNSQMKSSKEIFEDYLIVDSQAKTGSWLGVTEEKLSPALITSTNEKVLYSVGEFNPASGIGHNVIKFPVRSLKEIVSRYVGLDNYIFPADLKWLLIITHESQSFLGGSQKFIEKVKKHYPDWKAYKPDWDAF
jgi:hypothetical protein